MGIFNRLKDLLNHAEPAAEHCERTSAGLIARGNELEKANRLDQAMQCYDAAVATAPKMARAHLSRGNVLLACGDPEGALAAYEVALACDPNYASAHYNSGNALLQLARREAALSCYNKATQLQPDFVDAWVAQGYVEEDVGRLEESVTSYRTALALRPDYAQVHSNLGRVLASLGLLDTARECYLRSLELNPSDPVVRVNLGNLLRDLGLLDSAEASFRMALELDPNCAEAFSNLGSVYTACGEFDKAEVSFRRALQIQPGFAEAYGKLLYAMNYSPDRSGEDIFAAYRRYDELFGLPCRVRWQPHRNSRDNSRRLKIGYVAPVFWQHSCRHFLEPLLANHDHLNFEIYAYAELSREDSVTERYRTYTDHWLSTQGMTDVALAQHMRDDEIDVLVDIAGHTAGNRLKVFALKPAPVSLHWLDFGYTTGLSAIDYYLTDWSTVPSGSESLFSETPWQLDGPGLVYRPADGMGAVGALPVAKRGYITFGTLTRAVRINRHTVRVWSEILKRVAGSRLIVNSADYRSAKMQSALVDRFAALGIDRERLSIGYHSPAWEVLSEIDIGLDCFPHNSGTTLIEGLYMGVPFVTLAGRPSVGRMGCAILHSVGHSEWVAQTHDEYVAVAVALASSHQELSATRSNLRAQMRSSPLMDETGFARNVEAAYRQMFAKWASSR